MKLQLVKPDNPILTDKAYPVEFPDRDVHRIAAQMLQTMFVNNGCGLAAPQVGIPLRMFMYRAGGKIGAIINPTITYRNPDLIESVEGCLTYPGLCWKVKRANAIRISYQSLDAERLLEIPAVGLFGIICQHETDHLDGILISQHGTPHSR